MANPSALARLLDSPELPTECRSVWADFQALHSRRNRDEAGPCALTWEAVHAWQIVTHSRLEPWQLQAILMLDNLFLSVWNENK